LLSLRGDHSPCFLSISIPLIIQTTGIFVITYFLAFKLSIPYNVAAPAALATVVGVLVEVPIMLLLVNYANRTKHYFKENIDGIN
jgi:ACR3 family arsenite transporter